MSMNIVYSSSDSYMRCTSVSICSLLESNINVEDLNIFILSDDISDNNKNDIVDLGKRFGRKIEIRNAMDILQSFAVLANLPAFRGSYAVYASLCIANLFPNLDRVMVLDADTLVVDSLDNLWRLDLNGRPLAAVPDVGMYSEISSSEDVDIIYGSDLYFNTGVLVYDLAIWREQNIDEIIQNTIKEYEKSFRVVDQSILNLALKGNIYTLDLKYNYYTAVHGISFERMRKSFPMRKVFCEHEFSKAKIAPIIIHFVGLDFERPWFRRGVTIYKDDYISFLNKTSWVNEDLDELNWDKKIIFILYDEISILLRKCQFNNVYHWYRYVLGQKIKSFLGVSR